MHTSRSMLNASTILQLIAAAVTPVVMISAAAILISGINQKHQSLSDRVRSLAVEFRTDGMPESRKDAIRSEIALFLRRLSYVSVAHRLLHLSVGCFLLMVLVITMETHVRAWERLALGLFVAGVLLMLAAVLSEMLDLGFAQRTLRLDVRDVEGKEARG